jgi:hypothetical protein
MVESAAMASVALPAPNYVPQLPAKVSVTAFSAAPSLKRWSTRSMRHRLISPGRYRVPERGLELVPDADGANYRRGFFLGDGTGLAKAANSPRS